MLWTNWQIFARRKGKPLWSKEDRSSFEWCLILRFNRDSRRHRTGQERNWIPKRRSVVLARILIPQRKKWIYPYRWITEILQNHWFSMFDARRSWISWPLAYLMQAKDAADTSELSLRYFFKNILDKRDYTFKKIFL